MGERSSFILTYFETKNSLMKIDGACIV